MRPLYAVVVGVLALAFVLAGCGGAIPSSNGGPALVKLRRSEYGRFLVDGRGHTLYLFAKDGRGESYCGGACAAVWPPFETSVKPRASTGISAGALGAIKRRDGEMQVTYHGHPLYFYAADASSPGKTRGEEVDQFGAEWYLVSPRGQPLEAKSGPRSNTKPRSTSKPRSRSGAKKGGGGWG
jgi:predicted lipoprotein with Yx(FWY)xxD motif